MSFEALYDNKYVLKQLDKFNARHTNHWSSRINKVFDLVKEHCPPQGKVLDLGCSIGTYAFEFASRNYDSYGVDLSPESIDVANRLSRENNLDIKYQVSDIGHQSAYEPKSFDIIYAGDIVEHLMDDVLLQSLKNCHFWLKDSGQFIVHTVPTKYDKVFYNSRLWWLLVPFFWLPDFLFGPLVKGLFHTYDWYMKVTTGTSWIERERQTVHCNLQSKESLTEMLKRAGFKIEMIELSIMEDRFSRTLKYALFKNKEYFQKDIYAICRKANADSAN